MNIECRDKISPNCAGSFVKSVGRGRPSVNCLPCREASKSPSKPRTTAANPINPETNERTCGCGVKFVVKTGRGRKAEKCQACREAGTVYRRNDDGILEAIQTEQIERETRERREAAGATRALLLQMDMDKLFKKRGLAVSRH